jgi:hypothetical protein
MASAKAGAVMSVPCILLVLHALNFALLFVPNIPVGHEVSANTVAWVGEGKWYKLAWMHSSATAAIIAGGAALWAAEASIVAGIIALVKRRHRSG